MFGILRRKVAKEVQNVIDQVQLPVFAKNADGKFSFVNEAFADFIGKMPAQIIGSTDNDHFDRDLSRGFRVDDRRLIQRFQQNRRLRVLEKTETLPSPTGNRTIRTRKRCFLDSSGKLAGIIGVFFDYTAEKEVSEFFNIVYDKVNDVIFAYDNEGVVTRLNRAGCRLFGIRDETSLRERTLNFLSLVVDGQEADEFRSDSLGVIRLVPLRIEHAEHIMSVSAVQLGAGDDRRTVGIARDETEQILQARELNQTRQQLAEENAKLRASQRKLADREHRESISLVSAYVAHEFTGPISQAEQAVEALLASLEARRDIEVIADMLPELQNVHAELQNTRNQIREYLLRIKSGKARPERNGAHVGLVRARNQLRKSRTVKCRIDDKGIDDTLPDILIDRISIDRSMYNLLGNAVSYCEGAISLKSYLSKIGNVIIHLNDDGPGFSSACMEILGDPSKLASDDVVFPSERGSGVGLGNVYRLLALDQGVQFKFIQNGGELGGAVVELEIPTINEEQTNNLMELATKSFSGAFSIYLREQPALFYSGKKLKIGAAIQNLDKTLTWRVDPGWGQHLLQNFLLFCLSSCSDDSFFVDTQAGITRIGAFVIDSEACNALKDLDHAPALLQFPELPRRSFSGIEGLVLARTSASFRGMGARIDIAPAAAGQFPQICLAIPSGIG